MRVYKTWEIFKDENVNKKWCRKNGFKKYHFSSGILKDETDDNAIISTYDDWYLVQEPVDFITAVQSGKRMRPDDINNFKYNELDWWLMTLDNCKQTIAKELIAGKWFIEE